MPQVPRVLCVVSIALLLSFFALGQDWSAGVVAPHVSIERYELPVGLLADDELLGELEAMTGVAGTTLSGVRVRVAMPAGYRFDGLTGSIADGLLLERRGGFVHGLRQVLAHIARLLLFGKLVDATDELELPSSVWFLMLDGDPSEQADVDVSTTESIDIDPDDGRVTNHGDYVVCRLMVAASALTELVQLEIRGRNDATGRRVNYKIPRLVVPVAQREPVPGAAGRRDPLAHARAQWEAFARP